MVSVSVTPATPISTHPQPYFTPPRSLHHPSLPHRLHRLTIHFQTLCTVYQSMVCFSHREAKPFVTPTINYTTTPSSTPLPPPPPPPQRPLSPSRHSAPSTNQWCALAIGRPFVTPTTRLPANSLSATTDNLFRALLNLRFAAASKM